MTGRTTRFPRALPWLPWLAALPVAHFAADRAPWGALGVVCAAAALRAWRRDPRATAAGGAIALALSLAVVALEEPRSERDWWPALSRLPRIQVDGDRVTIEELRSFRWHDAPGSFDPAWTTRRYDLRELEAVELIIEPFGDSRLLAHTMLGFGFADGERVVLSIEARKEKGEDYGLLAGALRRFELAYLYLDERDALVLRAVQRGARLYAFPVDAGPEHFRALFLELAATANGLAVEPRFYRSLLDNCTTAWVRHVDRQLERPIGLRFETLFPALTGRLLHESGFMKTTLSLEEATRRFRIDPAVRRFRDHPDFSRRIRASGG